jgi:alpha-mannosidase
VLDAADALDKKMTEVEEGLIQTKAKSGEDALNFPIRVMNQMVDLANVAQESDAAPTAQSYQVYEVLNKELDVQLAKWKEVQSTELVALNQKMREANVPGVSIPPAKPNEPAPGRRRGN